MAFARDCKICVPFAKPISTPQVCTLYGENGKKCEISSWAQLGLLGSRYSGCTDQVDFSPVTDSNSLATNKTSIVIGIGTPPIIEKPE